MEHWPDRTPIASLPWLPHARERAARRCHHSERKPALRTVADLLEAMRAGIQSGIMRHSAHLSAYQVHHAATAGYITPHNCRLLWHLCRCHGVALEDSLDLALSYEPGDVVRLARNPIWEVYA